MSKRPNKLDNLGKQIDVNLINNLKMGCFQGGTLGDFMELLVDNFYRSQEGADVNYSGVYLPKFFYGYEEEPVVHDARLALDNLFVPKWEFITCRGYYDMCFIDFEKKVWYKSILKSAPKLVPKWEDSLEFFQRDTEALMRVLGLKEGTY